MGFLEPTDNSSLYAEYENLLLERDAYKKEAGSYSVAYIKEFGELITKVFRKKIDCIAKKKAIAFCQMSLNKGKIIDAAELEKYVKSQTEEYRKQLDEMLSDYDECKKAEVCTEYEYQKSKAIYRRIAKKLHPDINPGLAEIPRIFELWNRVQAAYRSNSVKELEELEVIVNRVLKEENITSGDIVIDNIEEKIEDLKAEIHAIITNDPYKYKYILEDRELTQQKKDELTAELNEYTEYENELKKVLTQFLGSGVIVPWQEN